MQIALTPEQFAAAAVRVKQQAHLNITTPSGQIKTKGVTVTYRYDGKSMLHISILDKPFYCTEQHLEDQILIWFASQPAPQQGA